MDAKPELVVPTVAVPVHLALTGQPAAIAAELFVADVPRNGRAQLLDDLADMLESTSEFVPVRVGRTVRLYAKHAIAWICVRRRDDVPSDYDGDPSEVIVLYDRQHRVAVELRSGGAIAGVLFDSSPSDHPRAVDHLNRSGRFVRLWTASEHYLIHNVEILHVTEQE